MKTTRDRTGRLRLARPIAAAGALLLGAGVAALSYVHALTVARGWGDAGRTVYLVPLLGDGLIVVCSAALYEAAQAKADSPVQTWQARTGLVLGIAVTVALNVAYGWHHGLGDTCLNALPPLVLLVAIEVVVVMYRRTRDKGDDPADHAGDAEDRCPHGVARSLNEAIRLDFLHRRDCLFDPPSQRDHALNWKVSKTTVARLVDPAPEPVSQNGNGPHETEETGWPSASPN